MIAGIATPMSDEDRRELENAILKAIEYPQMSEVQLRLLMQIKDDLFKKEE